MQLLIEPTILHFYPAPGEERWMPRPLPCLRTPCESQRYSGCSWQHLHDLHVDRPRLPAETCMAWTRPWWSLNLGLISVQACGLGCAM